MRERTNIVKMVGAALALLLVAVIISGCMKAQADDPNMKTIESVLALQFNGPDAELIDAMWNPANKKIVDGAEVNETFDRYVEEIYGQYFTENELDIFMRVFGTYFISLADIYGYDLSLEDVDIEQSEQVDNRYSFTAEVAYQQAGGKEQHSKVEGVVLFSTTEEGKIGKFTYTSDQGLSENLKQ
ncbi:hypothetical protein [Planococcus sp. ISL-109]|uniref:hypothetical protein n=1 Tax=Planococcus sp. ISL-109 TaxID=2819166 RepID=UPI001BE9C0E7|nr:hypothetical protein [Planococcus sp. ISL-109]MBT2583340.1 hypothetical protein [Planococcus sp. ISL-109]